MKKQYVRIKERKNNNKIKLKMKLCLKITLLLPGWSGSEAECQTMNQKITILF